MDKGRAPALRGRKHFWRNPHWFEGSWDEGDMICDRCGAIGERQTYSLPSATGWFGKPIYGCRTIASAIEARSDATGTGAAVGESAVPQGDAQ